MRLIARLLGFIFTTAAILFVVAACAVGLVVWNFEKDLPDYTQLQNYEPKVMTRVHAGDGSLLAEYARERRLYLPSAAIPPLVKNAFISAEDKNFYHHAGVDPEGILRATFATLFPSKVDALVKASGVPRDTPCSVDSRVTPSAVDWYAALAGGIEIHSPA